MPWGQPPPDHACDRGLNRSSETGVGGKAPRLRPNDRGAIHVPEPHSTTRILVVDDDKQVRTLLRDLLTHDGHVVDVAGTAPDAVRLLLRNRYSLLITDLEMPDTSGVELIQEVRARGLRLPILAVSGTTEIMREAAVLNLGLAEYLPKPFAIDEVRNAVTRLLAAAEEQEKDSDTPTPRGYPADRT